MYNTCLHSRLGLGGGDRFGKAGEPIAAHDQHVLDGDRFLKHHWIQRSKGAFPPRKDLVGNGVGDIGNPVLTELNADR
jgi:hypothetical protein